MASTAAVKSLCVAPSSLTQAASRASGAPSAPFAAPFFGRALTGSKACSSAFSGRQLGLSRVTSTGGQCVMVADAPSKESDAKPPSYYMNFEPPADIDEFTREFMNSTLEDEDPEYDAMWKKFFFDKDEEVVEAVDEEEDGLKRLRPPERRKKDQYQENVVQVSRVNKTVKGGNQLSFRAVVVIGDGKGAVGVGVGKAKEVMNAVLKAGVDARRQIIKVPLNKQKSIPHRMEGRYGAAKVLLRPAPLGTGVIAGGSVRTVLEMAGVENTFGKQLGSNNPLNNARATVVAIGNMFDRKEVAEFRKVPIESLRV